MTHRKRTIQITIKREHGGLYWMEQEDFQRLVPELELDSTETLFVIVHASNALDCKYSPEVIEYFKNRQRKYRENKKTQLTSSAKTVEEKKE